LIIHQFPLPYIIASFESSKSVYVVEKYQKNRLLEYLDFSIMNGQEISSRTVFNKTGVQIRDLIFEKFVSRFDISKDIYNQEMYGNGFSILQRDGLKRRRKIFFFLIFSKLGSLVRVQEFLVHLIL